MTPRQFDALRKRKEEADERDDYRTALLCAVIANCAPREKGAKAFTPEDFMPRSAPKRPQTPDEMLEIAKIYCLANGGEIVEVEGPG